MTCKLKDWVFFFVSLTSHTHTRARAYVNLRYGRLGIVSKHEKFDMENPINAVHRENSKQHAHQNHHHTHENGTNHEDNAAVIIKQVSSL